MPTTQLDGLKAARERALMALKHRMDVILTFTDETSTSKVKVSEKLLENSWSEFKSANDELDGKIIDEPEVSTLLQGLCDAEDKYVEAKTLLAELIAEENDTASFRNNSSRGNSESSFKINRLLIKPFSGKYEDWTEFKDIFESCFSNAQIPDVQKLHHLETC